MNLKKIFLGLLFFCTVSIKLQANTDSRIKHAPVQLPLEIVKIINHDDKSYTQGLYYDNGIRFESSGLYGKSFIRRFGQHEQKTQRLSAQYFAEGLTVIDDTLYLLTWKAETLLLFDKTTLSPKGSLSYKGQGWGLTHNDDHFIMSNGSNTLSFRNKNSFAVEKTIVVAGVDKLNELEYVDGIIWANRWYDDRIYAINENNGCVIGTIDVGTLREQSTKYKRDNVTNGIAYQASNNTLLITGKYWSRQFFIRLPDVSQEAAKPCR